METSAEYFRSEVPTGVSGAWAVEKISIAARDYDPKTDPRPDCFKFRPGHYTCLRRDATQFMTDLYDEWWTQREAINAALRRGGDVLVTGLGLGLVAEAILRPAASTVRRITVVELSEDVIRLVKPHLEQRHPGRIEVIAGNAFTWEPPDGQRFSVGWHDIWPDPHGPAVVDEMRRLGERYSAWCDWQGFWPKSYLDALVAD